MHIIFICKVCYYFANATNSAAVKIFVIILGFLLFFRSDVRTV